MQYTETIIVGGGQAGLALSRCLAGRGRDHVVFERGRIGERWRSQRWESLRLLTPNWMTRLPGHRYQGQDPDGFMTRNQVVDLLQGYARSFGAPVLERTAVLSAVPPADGWSDGWEVETDRGTWLARNLVVATGHCDVPNVPAVAAGLAPDVHQVTTDRYRDPDCLPPGGVLVVGASATGVQLADEIRRSGREVVLAVGGHNRLPRRYRGRDVMWWLDRLGVLDRSIDDMPSPETARRERSLQLAGRPGGESLDLQVLKRRGVRLTGRLVEAEGSVVRFADDLRRLTGDADDRLEKLLARIDRHITTHGLDERFPRQEPPRRLELPDDGPRRLDLAREGIGTVLWATGFRREYPWLHAPVLDDRGEIVHHRGRTSLPGLYVLGLQFMIRRRSSFLDGVGRDAEEIAERIDRAPRTGVVAAA